MSISRQRARDLVRIYDHSLEQQIVEHGCSLACRDERLWKDVEGLLMDTDAQETHCLGLDPLGVMEESLKAAATSAAYGWRFRIKGGLRGLAKAFEILEQAALNLYLGPWREEYRVIKMYSGTFTHYISPVLSMPQIEKLFGLLGYKLNSSQPTQLSLQSPKVHPACLDDLLRLSCAFFVARCECQLLLSALGKHVGDAQWELSMVRERRRGNSLQVALDNTKKDLEVNQAPMELTEEVDLYGDEQTNRVMKEAVVCHDENPLSLINGMSSTPLDTCKSFTASMTKIIHSDEESKSNMLDSKGMEVSGQAKGEPDASLSCSCLHSSVLIKHCSECDTLHNFNCASLEVCNQNGHKVQFAGNLPEKRKSEGEISPPSGFFSSTSSSVAMSSSAVCDDDTKSENLSLHPISYHNCCDLFVLHPQVLCRSCHVFHSGSCMEGEICQKSHDTSELGTCSCGRLCSRKPLVLCRYCGKEYCRDCWYRSPVICSCGQTFDQSSPV